jgi:hypothetical protein
MTLTTDHLDSYRERGYVFVTQLFREPEVDVLMHELPALQAHDSPERVLEKDGSTVRAVFGSHTTNDVMRRLAYHPRLVESAMALLGTPVYIYQFKINFKAAFAGDVWPWHQDYIYWQREDGMPAPRALTAAVFLDDVTELNGPLLFVPKTQDLGVLGPKPRETAGNWRENVVADLKYTLTADTLRPLVHDCGIDSPKGPRGSVIFFHCNVVHGSGPNMSPFDRRLAFVTFNSVENLPVPMEHPRPSFLVGRDHTPVRAVADDALMAVAGRAASARR